MEFSRIINMLRRHKEIPAEEPKAEPEPSVPEKIKVPVTVIYIYFNDGTNLAFSVTKNDDSFVTSFYSFYRWFFHRPQSEWYTFVFHGGAEVFCRKDIKRISFKTTTAGV